MDLQDEEDASSEKQPDVETEPLPNPPGPAKPETFEFDDFALL